MGLFGKKKEESKAPSCACQGGCAAYEATGQKAEAGAAGGALSVKVLGMGCASCHAQYEAAKEAVRNMGLEVEVEYVTDLQKLAAYGIMSAPAIVVNEKVVSSGKVLTAAGVEKLLRKTGV